MDTSPVQIDPSSIQPLPAAGGGGVTIDPSSITPISGSHPDNGQPPSNAPDALKMNQDPTTLSGGLHNIAAGLNSVSTGIVHGALDTIGGGLHIADKLTGTDPTKDKWTQAVDQKKQELDKLGQENPTATAVGKGGESLVEFLMGDEALKGLSFADRLTHAARTAKLLEKSPKMMKAFQIGAEALNNHKALQIGADALGVGVRQGAVQAGQTLVKSGGDVGQAAESGLTAGVTGGLLHGALGGSQAATSGKSALVKSAAGAGVGGAAGYAVGGSTGGAIGAVTGAVGGGAEGSDITRASNAAGELEAAARDKATSAADVSRALADTMKERFAGPHEAIDQVQAEQHDAIAKAHQEALDKVNQTFSKAHERILTDHGAQTAEELSNKQKAEDQQAAVTDSLKNRAAGAAPDSAITDTARHTTNQTQKELYDTYGKGLEDISSRVKDTVAPEETPIAEQAKALLEKPKPSDHPSVSNLKALVGDNLKPGIKSFIERIAGGGGLSDTEKTVASTEEPLPYEAYGMDEPTPKESTPEPSRPYSVKDLTDLRKYVRKTAELFEPGDPNARALRSLMNPIDDTIEKLAEKSGDPAAFSDYQKLRSDYRNKAWAYDHPVVQQLRDGKLADIDAKLMGPQAAAPKGPIEALKTALGDEGWKQFSKDSADRLVSSHIKDDGSINYSGLTGKLERMGPEGRQALYGKDGDGLLESLTKHKQAVEAGSAAEDNLAQLDKTKTANLKGIGDTAAGKTDQLNKEAEAQRKEIQDAASTKHDEVNKTISNLVGSGDISGLLKDPERLDEFTKAAGPKGVKSLANMTLDNWIHDASTTVKDGQRVVGPIRSKEVLDKLAQFKDHPEAFDKFFRADPETAARYDDVMKKLQNIEGVKKLVKFGVLVPSLGAVASVAHSVLGPAGEVIAFLGTKGMYTQAGAFADYLASKPSFWDKVGAAGHALDSSKGALLKGARAAQPVLAHEAGQAVTSDNQPYTHVSESGKYGWDGKQWVEIPQGGK